VKLIQGLIALLVVGLAGGVVVHYWMSGAMERLIGDNTYRIDTQEDLFEQVREETGKRLDDHETRLGRVEATTREQDNEIERLRGQLSTLGSRVGELEKDSAELAKLGVEMAALRRHLDTLTSENDDRVRGGTDLRKRLQNRDAEFEQRLQAIEGKLGLEKPLP